MTAPHADQLIEGYLARLRLAAANLPAGAREELIGDVSSHITEARRRDSNETDASILNILDRLGEPEMVVTEARPFQPQAAGSQPGPGARLRQPPLLDLAIPILLALLWPVGVILLWYSTAWNARDKLIGTVLPLGGYPWILALSINAAHLGNAVIGPAGSVLGLVFLLLPLVVGGYMTYRLRVGRTAGRDLAAQG
jgi:hypothetical protein